MKSLLLLAVLFVLFMSAQAFRVALTGGNNGGGKGAACAGRCPAFRGRDKECYDNCMADPNVKHH